MASALWTGEEESAGGYLDKSLEKEWKVFRKTLVNFPHSFQLEDVEQVSKTSCRKLLNALLTDLGSNLATPLEIARTLNLIGYFYFLLDDPREAILQLDKALAQPDEHRNLVSLGNKAVILWQTGDRHKARDHVEILRSLKESSDFSYLVVRAKAELAFSYTRLGGHFCPKAITLFSEVITKARAPELWLWTFGLALTQRRLSHMSSTLVLAGATEEQKLMCVLETLLEVINNCKCKALKAKCYAEIAQLLQGRRGTKSQQQFEGKAKLTAVQACEKALEMDPNDCSVLWKCGKIYRYANRLDESVELLQKSIEQRPTTTEYHHLGLTYKKMAIRAKKLERGEWNQRGRGRPNYRRGRFRGRSRGGRCRERDWQEESREGREQSGIRGGRPDTESYHHMHGQEWGWGANQRGGREAASQEAGYFQRQQWTRYDDRGRNRPNAQKWQYDPTTNRSALYSGSYGQLRSPGGQRDETTRKSLNLSECLPQQSDISNDSGIFSLPYSLETVLGDEENITTPSQRSQQREEKISCEPAVEADLLSLDFSRLSLNADKAKALPSSQQQTQVSFHQPESYPVSVADSPQQASASQQEVRSLRQVVKSPSKEAEEFCRTDKYVLEALDAFQKAVEISEQENIRAVYDLALMHKDVREFDEALRLLDTIQLTKYKSMGPFDKINAFEQAGLILKDMSAMESDLKKEKKLKEEGESKLNTALRLCSRLCNRLPRLQHFIQDVWHSFPVLFEAAEQSDRPTTDKLFEKARLFRIIKANHQSMALLQEISNIAPEKAKSPDHLRMLIENYVDLEQYDQALTFIETLKCTAQRSMMELFDDEHYIQKVYMKAGKAALLSETSENSLMKAKSFFSSVFADVYGDRSDDSSSSEDTDSIGEGYGDDAWDIMLLHEDSADAKSEALANIFEKVFDLKVTDMYEDCLPGTLYEESLFCIMKRSKLVVVLAGATPVSFKLRILIGKAAKRPTSQSVTLLTDGNHVPKAMSSRRHMICPEEILSKDNMDAEGGGFPLSLAQKACDIFSFLVDIPFT